MDLEFPENLEYFHPLYLQIFPPLSSETPITQLSTVSFLLFEYMVYSYNCLNAVFCQFYHLCQFCIGFSWLTSLFLAVFWHFFACLKIFDCVLDVINFPLLVNFCIF